MTRLRIRIELNRGGAGVPLQKLAGVAQESYHFFQMLGADVQIDAKQGEWLAFDFDNKSLNFTAEFVGTVDPAQIQEFNAAFDGVTKLRRATIEQFARIAHSIDEDEVIGFGLYLDDAAEPSEWRSLSKRDALHITEEMRLLLASQGEETAQSPLPATLDPYVFGNAPVRTRREMSGVDIDGFLSTVEARLTHRLMQLEDEVSDHTSQIYELKQKSGSTEKSMQHLLTAVETFCDQAAGQFARITAQVEAGAAVPKAVAPPETAPALLPSAPKPWMEGWRIPALAAILLLVVLTGAYLVVTGRNESIPVQSAKDAVHPSSDTIPQPGSQAAVPQEGSGSPKTSSQTSSAQKASSQKTTTPAGPGSSATRAAGPPLVEAGDRTEPSHPRPTPRVEIRATDEAWVAATMDGEKVFERLLKAGEVRTVEGGNLVKLRLGNAGGAEVLYNGRSIGPVGNKGEVHLLEFTATTFKNNALKAADSAAK